MLDVPDVVSIQYQEGDKPDVGAWNVSLQVSLLTKISRMKL